MLAVVRKKKLNNLCKFLKYRRKAIQKCVLLIQSKSKPKTTDLVKSKQNKKKLKK